ncbi:hypothetical protein, partial [Acetobacter persici]
LPCQTHKIYHTLSEQNASSNSHLKIEMRRENVNTFHKEKQGAKNPAVFKAQKLCKRLRR